MIVQITKSKGWYTKGDFFDVEYKKHYNGFYRLMSNRKYTIDPDHCIQIIQVPTGFECPKQPETDFALETDSLIVRIAYSWLTRYQRLKNRRYQQKFIFLFEKVNEALYPKRIDFQIDPNVDDDEWIYIFDSDNKNEPIWAFLGSEINPVTKHLVLCDADYKNLYKSMSKYYKDIL